MDPHSGLRAVTTAALAPAVIPLLESVGTFWTFTISAIIAWMGFACVYSTSSAYHCTHFLAAFLLP
jgi:hypothetical protein